MDKFTYLRSSVSATENDINTQLAWTAVERLSVVWKSDLTDKIKYSFFQAAVLSILLDAWLHHMDASCIEQVLEATPHKAAAVWPPATHHETIQIRWTRHTGHCRRSKDELINDMILWTLSHGWAKVGWPARTYIQQLCADTRCSLEDLPGAMDDSGQRESGRCVLVAWHDDKYLICELHIISFLQLT